MNKLAATVTVFLSLLGGPAKDVLGSDLVSNDMVKYRRLEAKTYIDRIAESFHGMLQFAERRFGPHSR